MAESPTASHTRCHRGTLATSHAPSTAPKMPAMASEPVAKPISPSLLTSRGVAAVSSPVSAFDTIPACSASASVAGPCAPMQSPTQNNAEQYTSDTRRFIAVACSACAVSGSSTRLECLWSCRIPAANAGGGALCRSDALTPPRRSVCRGIAPVSGVTVPAAFASRGGPRYNTQCSAGKCYRGPARAQIANSQNILNLYQISNLKSYCKSVLESPDPG